MTNFTASPQRFPTITTESDDNVTFLIPEIQEGALSRSQFIGLGVYLTIAGEAQFFFLV